MKWRVILVSTMAIVLCACSSHEGSKSRVKELASKAPFADEAVSIYRDAYGTPHVFADSNRGVYYGYGYAVATDRLFQMEMLRRTTQGRVAEVLGKQYLALDKKVRSSYDHPGVVGQLAALAPSEREILQAYADGFSARVTQVIADRDTLLPVEFTEFGFMPDAWDAYDVAMLFVGSIAHRYSDFNSERDNLSLLRSLEARLGKETAWKIFSASKWLLDKDSPVTVPGHNEETSFVSGQRPAYLDKLTAEPTMSRVALDTDGRFAGITSDPAVAAAQRETLEEIGFTTNPEFMGASNYWAMRDLKDASAAMVNGPQFGFSVPGYVYGIGLHGGDFNVVGNTLLALPTLLFAHNNHIAWGSTAGISDQSDEFALQLNPKNTEQYRYDGGWRDFESWTEVIAVKGEKSVSVTARRSVHGIVQSWQPEEGIAWSRAWGWEGGELDSLMSWVMLATDKSMDAAHSRIGRMRTNINMYTMDRNGNLGYVHAGRYPQRTQGHDPRLPVPGDGSFDWQGLRPYSDNPTVRNPKQGYIANWNNRPREDWVSTDLWTYTWGRADRARILFDSLDARRGGTVADIESVNREISFADVNAPFLLPYLFEAFESVAEQDAAADALAHMQAWDHSWNADEAGTYGPANALMDAWLRLLLVEVLKDDVGEDKFYLYAATNSLSEPLGPSIPNPPGVKVVLRNLDCLTANCQPDYDFFNGQAPAELIRKTFDAAVALLVEAQGADSSTWTLKAHPMQWKPFNFRGVPQASESRVVELPGYHNRGSENNLFVATGKGIEARDVIPPGQSGFVGPKGASPHLEDQLSLYAQFGYKNVPFTREDVKAVAADVVTLQVPK